MLFMFIYKIFMFSSYLFEAYQLQDSLFLFHIFVKLQTTSEKGIKSSACRSFMTIVVFSCMISRLRLPR